MSVEAQAQIKAHVLAAILQEQPSFAPDWLFWTAEPEPGWAEPKVELEAVSDEVIAPTRKAQSEDGNDVLYELSEMRRMIVRVKFQSEDAKNLHSFAQRVGLRLDTIDARAALEAVAEDFAEAIPISQASSYRNLRFFPAPSREDEITIHTSVFEVPYHYVAYLADPTPTESFSTIEIEGDFEGDEDPETALSIDLEA